MARSEALAAARSSYERAHLGAALRGIGVAAAITGLALALGRQTHATWIIASIVAATLAVLGWRGGAWRRGSLAGVLAGLPPLIAPSLVFALSHGGHCPDCELGPTLPCMLACFGTSTLVGVFVGHAASRDLHSRRYALAAIASAVATGLLGCSTTGLGGAIGIVAGMVAGSVTGWLVAGRHAHA